MNDVVIELNGVSKKYNLYHKKSDRLKEAIDPRGKKYHRDFFALKNMNLQIKKGEIVGIVGKNGSGKSTLLKIIAGVLTPTEGNLAVNGKVVALLELGSGLNPEFTGIENIYFYGAILGYSKRKMESILPEIIAFSELDDFIDQPLKTYSSGMKARLGFAVSVFVEPEILILDEVLSVGDELFRRKCHAKMEEFFAGGKTILYVTHSVSIINQLCTRAIFVDKGECIIEGPTKLVTSQYERYLYAEKSKVEEVKQEIFNLSKNEELKKIIYDEINRDAKEDFGNMGYSQSDIDFSERLTAKRAYYIPDFVPKSTVEYKNYEVLIEDIMIRTHDGEKVNALIMGDEYIYSYRVRFEEPFVDINFGMFFKTLKGAPIGGGIFPEADKYIPHVAKGDEYLVEWYFKCNFLPGDYFCNLGVLGKKNSSDPVTYVNRITDAFVFKVQLLDTKKYTGFFFFYQTPNIVKLRG
jgi:lipopolysaccharide transport system ATP-binding protein